MLRKSILQKFQFQCLRSACKYRYAFYTNENGVKFRPLTRKQLLFGYSMSFVLFYWPYQESYKDMNFIQAEDPRHIGNIGKDVEIKAIGKSSMSLILTLCNTTNRSIAINIPEGTFFANCNMNYQPLICAESRDFILLPKEEQTVTLKALCGKQNLKIPRGNTMEATNYVYTNTNKDQIKLWHNLLASYISAPASRQIRLNKEKELMLKEERERKEKHDVEEKNQDRTFRELNEISDSSTLTR